MDDKTVNDLIKKYAPVLYFHPDEVYLPTSTDEYLSHCMVLDSGGNASDIRFLGIAGADTHLQLSGQVADNVRRGNLGVARAYVNVVNSGVGGQYDIQYWFYYAFNGPTTSQFDGPVGKSTTNEAPPSGQHDGDWEHIVVRVADSGNIVSVFFAEHGSGQWC